MPAQSSQFETIQGTSRPMSRGRALKYKPPRRRGLQNATRFCCGHTTEPKASARDRMQQPDNAVPAPDTMLRRRHADPSGAYARVKVGSGLLCKRGI